MAEQARITEQATPARPHALTLEGRSRLGVTAVLRILTCDDTTVTLRTPMGDLTVGGQELQVNELSVHSGEVRITGKIEYLQYSENKESAGGLLARLFK